MTTMLVLSNVFWKNCPKSTSSARKEKRDASGEIMVLSGLQAWEYLTIMP
jgi:hypothetical protein